MGARRGSAVLAVLLLLPGALLAQVGKPRPGAVRGATVGASADTAATRDSLAAYEQLQANTLVRMATAPRLGGEGPLPAAARMIFTRDSIDWAGAATVGDLVARMPGTYLWRGGGIGRPEPVNYAGRGVASVEYVLDGMPYRPLGPDSLAVDPADISLGLIDRVEIERWPSQLRVYLYTRNHDRLAARSHIVLAAGPDKLAHYEASLERRFRGGFGVGVAGDYLKVPPAGGATGTDEQTGYWAQLSYVPSARAGVLLEYLGVTLNRDEFTDAAGTGARAEGRRGELRGRAFIGGREDGTGLRLDLLGSRSGFDSMGVAQALWQGGAALNYRAPLVSAAASALYGGRWTSLDADARLSWTPTQLLTIAAEGVYRRHDGARTTRWLGARAGLVLPAGFEASASGRVGQAVSAPALLASPEQDVRELEGALLWNTRRLGFEGRIARTAAFAPIPFQEYPDIAAIAPLPVTTWLSGGGFVRPLDWITVRGWYAQASKSSPEGMPPRHWSMTGTIRTKFLHTFRSGAFDLKLELGYEGWRAGTLAEDGTGLPVTLGDAHYVRSLVQVAIESFSVFWESRNLTGETAGYVPGFQVPKFSGFFGVRWGFLN